MRFALCLICLPGLAWADDILIRGDVTAALVYPNGATTTRSAGAEVPAGDHRLLIPLPGANQTPDIELTGASLVNTALLSDAGFDLETLDTPAQASARAALEKAEAVTRAAQRYVEAAKAAAQAAETRLRWLGTLTGGGEGGLNAPRDGERMIALLDTLGAQTAAAVADRVAASADIETAQKALEEAREAEVEAREALNRLRPLPDGTPLLALSVSLAEAGPVVVEMESFDFTAFWRPRYDLHLDTEGETLALDRKVAISQTTNEIWTDVALTLSTADPNRGTNPTDPRSTPARAVEPRQEAAGVLRAPSIQRAQPMPGAVQESVVLSGSAEMGLIAAAPEPVAAVPVVHGLSITYPYPRPVTLEPGAEILLALDTLDLPVELENRAVPRNDRTAFLVATITNDGAEPILPGEATLYRDGDRIGKKFFAQLPAGGKVEQGYGPLDHIRLSWVRLARGEGDSGVFSRSSTLSEAIAFEVENVGGAAEDVTVLYSLPFSEQEDVGVEVTPDPRPTSVGYKDRRGVAQWDFSLDAGAKQRVEITFEIDWPEELNMTWRP